MHLARHVDGDIDVTEARACFADAASDIAFLSRIAGEGDCGAAARSDEGGSFARGIEIAVAYRDPRPFARQEMRNCATNIGAGAEDESDLVLESIHRNLARSQPPVICAISLSQSAGSALPRHATCWSGRMSA